MEKSPRESVPVSVMEVDRTGVDAVEVDDAVSNVKAERAYHQARADDGLELMRSLDSTSTAEDIDAAYELRREAQDRLDAFNEMWTNFGGDAVDAAQAVVDKLAFDPTTTKYDRAKDKLKAAEDAFHAKMQEAAGNIYDEASAINDIEDAKSSSLAADERADVEGAAYEAAAERAGVRNADRDAVHDEANQIHEDLEGRAREDREVAAGTRIGVAEIGRAHDEASAINDIEDAKSSSLAADERADVEGAAYEAAAERAGVRNADRDAVHGEALDMEGRAQEAREVAAGTRIGLAEIGRAETEAYEEERARRGASWRNPGARLSYLFTSNVERFRNANRRTKVGVVLSAVALAAVIAGSIYAYRQGNPEAAQSLSDNLNPPTPPVDLGDFVPPVSGAEVPPVSFDGYHDLYGWAADHFGSADKAMPGLHEISNRAAAAGKIVEWHGSGTHEWVEVDGVSDPKATFELLRPFIK